MYNKICSFLGLSIIPVNDVQREGYKLSVKLSHKSEIHCTFCIKSKTGKHILFVRKHKWQLLGPKILPFVTLCSN